MSKNLRIKTSRFIDQTSRISFKFNNKTYYGFKGDTLASALLANNVHLVGRSFKYHRPRGIMTAGSEEPNAIVQINDAAMGPKAAMACTIAVEEVIGEHYQKQADILGEDERDLHAIVERFRDEELEHRDIAVDHDGREARHYDLLRNVIQRGCRTAIKIAEKI